MASRKTTEQSARVVVDNTSGEPADHRDDEGLLDEFEREADDYILDDADGDEPGAIDEIKTIDVDKQLPKFANFRSNPETRT